MGVIRFCSDPHFGHNNMAIHRGFQGSFYHDEKIVDNWNNTVNKKDTTYILGDVTMEKRTDYEILDRLNGNIIVVLGNHDMKIAEFYINQVYLSNPNMNSKDILQYIDICQILGTSNPGKNYYVDDCAVCMIR